MQHWQAYVRSHPKVGPWYVRFERQPGWVVKATVIAAVVIVVIPLLLLTLAAVLVGGLAFLVFSAVARVVGHVKAFLSGKRSDAPERDGDGRVNVRVIRR